MLSSFPIIVHLHDEKSLPFKRLTSKIINKKISGYLRVILLHVKSAIWESIRSTPPFPEFSSSARSGLQWSVTRGNQTRSHAGRFFVAVTIIGIRRIICCTQVSYSLDCWELRAPCRHINGNTLNENISNLNAFNHIRPKLLLSWKNGNVTHAQVWW